MSSPAVIRELAAEADAVIGAVLLHGAKAPRLITRDMLKSLKPGAVLVDVAIDQGGCFETSRPTTHGKPVYEVDGIIHYCVANMPGAVPMTCVQEGLNIVKGKVVYRSVAEAFGLEHTPVEAVLDRG